MSLEADEKIHVAMDTKESRGTGECIAPFTKKKNFTIYIFYWCVLNFVVLRDYGQRNIIPTTFLTRECKKKKFLQHIKKLPDLISARNIRKGAQLSTLSDFSPRSCALPPPFSIVNALALVWPSFTSVSFPPRRRRAARNCSFGCRRYWFRRHIRSRKCLASTMTWSLTSKMSFFGRNVAPSKAALM